jgi:uncharacterized protein YjgD (DUF1641 family)
MAETSAAEALRGLAAAVQDALGDEMIGRMSELAVRLLPLVASPAAEETLGAVNAMLPAIARFTRRLQPMVEAGVLDRLADLLELAMAASDAVTAEQVERLADRGQRLLALADDVMRRDPALLWEKGIATATEAWRASADTGSPSGTLGLLAAWLFDPAARRMLAFLLSVARGLAK